MNNSYSIVIQWSEQHDCFVATLPEWGDLNAQGDSYEQALMNAQEKIESLIESSVTQGESLPEAETFQIRVNSMMG